MHTPSLFICVCVCLCVSLVKFSMEKLFVALVILQFYEIHNMFLKNSSFSESFIAKNTSYILVMESRSWSAAQSYCRTYHTDLTSIRSKEEKSNITLTLNGSGVQYVWIGLYRDPWAFWSDNTTSTFTNWMSYQPDNLNSIEYCGDLYLMSGKLNDGNCGVRIYFFCFTGEVQNANTVRSCHHVKH
uniref:C-type lectin domain-containing protein n=1 Tax=Oreochromis aureus TaxID=47969 RepID=A0A668RD89_OREAU